MVRFLRVEKTMPRTNSNNNNSASRGGRGGGRGRGGGGRGRNNHNNNNRRPPPRDYHNNSSHAASVPTSQQVVPGAGVAIILKMDQPTGRQVQGIVGTVLGRGNHPRGIKVQLVDGRVGRVQGMVNVETARAASAGLHNLGRNGESSSWSELPMGYRSRMSQKVSGMDNNDIDNNYNNENRPSATFGDYLTAPPPSANAVTAAAALPRQDNADTSETTMIVSCPVCGNFEGDEAAVAFHVNSHFT